MPRAAEGRCTSFVGRPTAAPFVFAALNRVNIVEDTAILVFHVRVIVFHVRRHSRFMIPRRSYHARLRADRDRHDTIPRIKSYFRKILNFQKNRKISLEPVRHPQKVSMCHLKVIPIHFLEPKIGPKNFKNHQNC